MITKFNDCTVDLVQVNASDNMVIAAAKVSTLGSESLTQLDGVASKGFINFLMKNRHGSPFEHNSFTFFIEAPIMVFREFHRHRIGWSYSETSGRYKELDSNFYFPPEHRPLVQVGKPGEYNLIPGDEFQEMSVRLNLVEAYTKCWEAYQEMLKQGVAKEVARLVLPVGLMTSMYATCNARSLMAFLSLRTDSPAASTPSKPQWEIDKLVAAKMEQIFADYMPLTYETWCENGRVAP